MAHDRARETPVRRIIEPPPAEWSVTFDGWGRPQILDAYGVPIHRHQDPVTALQHCFLASQAPRLKAVVAPLVRRLERIEVDHGIPVMGRDERRIGDAWHALLCCHVPDVLLRAAEARRTQLVLDWNDAA